MPVYDANGNLKVVGDLASNIDVRESGSIVSPNATFVNFVGEGGTDVSVVTSGSGVTVTVSSSLSAQGSSYNLVVASGSSGQIVTSSANFINFTGPGIESVNISGSGVTVTTTTGSGGSPFNLVISSGSAGAIVTASVNYINFQGSAIQSAVVSGSGVSITITSGSGGPGGSSTFSKGGVFLDPIFPTDTVIWRSDGSYTLTNVRGYLSGATPCSASINTRVNSSANLSSNLFITTSGNWWVGDTPINTSVVAGDSLEIRLLSLSGSVKYVNIQVDLSSS